MIRIVIVVVALLLLVGAVIGGLYFWGFDPLAKFDQLMGNAPPAAEAAKGPPPAPKPPPATYVDFGLLVVPVVQGREVRRTAEMILRLDVNPDKKELVAQNIPRIQNGFLSEMMSFLPSMLRDGAPMDQVAVRRRLTAVAQQVLGPGMVRDVLIEQSSIRQ